MITYKVVWACGCQKYFHLKSEAITNYNARNCPLQDTEACESSNAESLSKVTLTPDAFERAANGGGGYEENEVILKKI